MSQIRAKAGVRIPLLDNLLAGDATDPGRGESSVRILRDSIRRDLELLFNTRPRHRTAPARLTELQTSVITYGLSDLQTRPLADELQREAFRLYLETHIRRFEPRLQNLTVEVSALADQLDRSLRFRIHGLLVTETGSEPIVFNTMLDPASRNIAFDGDGIDAI